MLLDTLKQANITALKAHDSTTRSVLSLLLTKVKSTEIDLRTSGRELAEADIVSILIKTHKELVEERDAFAAAGRTEQVEVLNVQIAVVASYIPAMMTVDEILAEIATLEDKSMPAVMKHFKANFAGKCNMGDVQKAIRSL